MIIVLPAVTASVESLQIVDLRKELESRTLSSKGLKSQLIARLTKAIKCEQEKEESQEQMEVVSLRH